MPDDTALVPGTAAGRYGNLAPQLGGVGMSPSLRVLLDEGMFERVKQLAGAMARAQGMTPAHLLGKPEACHVIVNIALDTGLSPYFVARHTYQTPGGQIGYDGALVQAILEQSGRFIGSPQMEYVGDWSKVIGKFEVKAGQRGGEFVKASWTKQDAAGLGVTVRWQVKGEPKPRVWPGEGDPFLLTQCFPLNSPLWGTDPKSQIAYLAIRRFANIAAPGILGAAGVAGEELIEASERAKDVTPAREPRREDFAPPVTDVAEETTYEVVDLDGEIHSFSSERQAIEALRMVLAEAAKQGIDRLDGAWDSNDGILLSLDPDAGQRLVRSYEILRERVVEAAKTSAAEVVQRHQEAAARHQTEDSGAGSPNDPRTPSLDQQDDRLGSAETVIAGEDRGEGDARLNEAADTSEPGHTGEEGGSPSPSNSPSQQRVVSPHSAANRPEPGEARPDDPPSPARDGPDRPIDPRGGPIINVPVNPKTHKADYRGWALAMFRPRLRRLTDAAVLPYFLGNHEPELEACRKGGLAGEDLAGLKADIKAAWDRCQ